MGFLWFSFGWASNGVLEEDGEGVFGLMRLFFWFGTTPLTRLDYLMMDRIHSYNHVTNTFRVMCILEYFAMSLKLIYLVDLSYFVAERKD